MFRILTRNPFDFWAGYTLVITQLFQSDIAKEHREQKETEKRSKMDSRQIAKSDAKKVKKQAQKEKKDMPKRREME